MLFGEQNAQWFCIKRGHTQRGILTGEIPVKCHTAFPSSELCWPVPAGDVDVSFLLPMKKNILKNVYKNQFDIAYYYLRKISSNRK